MRERGKRESVWRELRERRQREREREVVSGGGIERFHTPSTLNPILEREERQRSEREK